MNAETINKKIYIGRGKAAQRLGYDYQVYRPSNAANPLSHPVSIMPCAFNATDNNYKDTNKPGIPLWYGDFDRNFTQAGDYLVRLDEWDNPKQVYFIASQESLVPILCIECNATITASHSNNAVASGAVGAVGYSGLCANPAENNLILGSYDDKGNKIGWACSILFGKGRLRVESSLPSGSPEQMGWTILLPSSVPITFSQGMQLTDDRRRHFLINGAELSVTGWRLAVIEVHI